MYTPVLIQRCDMIGEDCERLPIGDVATLQIQFAANQGCSDDADTWFDESDPVELDAMSRIVGAEFFFDPL